jgi:Anp1.
MPLRNAENVLPMAFYNLMNLTYDHSLIDIAFLVSDCSPEDRTLETVFDYSVALQNGSLVEKLKKEEDENVGSNLKGSTDLYKLYMDQTYINNVKKAYGHPESHHSGYRKPFRSISIFKKDFGQIIGQGFSDRHAVKVQGIRRKLMGRARNWLTSSALKPYHSWVYWRDVDIETCPGNVIEDLMKHNFDVMVPNVWRPLPTFLGNEQPYDLNSWIESDPALELAKTLKEDDVIVEGYAEYPTWRAHLAYIRDPKGNPDEVVELDGVGGVSILARALIFRQGVHFPAFTFLNHAETEAFGKMAKKMGFKVGGLPHYTIWHIYEPSEDDLNQIAKMERKKRRTH